MKYNIKNELSGFDFSQAHIQDIEMTTDRFHLVLDQVMILPENSCNRDIRTMRTNGLLFTIENFAFQSLVEEGFTLYNANGQLTKTVPDRVVPAEEYAQVLEALVDGTVYEITKEENKYTFVFDGNDERTYMLTAEGTADREEWDRFLNCSE